MGKIIDLTNQKFGKLTVLRKTEKPKNINSNNRGVFWECKCECGNICVKRSTELRRGDTKSCGCLKHRIGKDNPLWEGHGDIPKSVYTSIKNWSAESRNLEFNLSIEYLWDLFLKQNKKCAYTGLELNFGTNRNDPTKTASLDRIDSSIGYVEGNVVWCHKTVNIVKMNQDLENFRKYCKLITNYEKESKAVISTIIEGGFSLKR